MKDGIILLLIGIVFLAGIAGIRYLSHEMVWTTIAERNRCKEVEFPIIVEYAELYEDKKYPFALTTVENDIHLYVCNDMLIVR